MSKISTYDVAPVPKLADKLIGTSVGGTPDDGTYNFTLQELLTLFLPNIPANNLQGVLDYGNTAIQDINLTGTIYTTDLDVSSTATILDSFLTGYTHITGGLFDVNASMGTAGQVLISTGFNVEWYTIPTVIPDLQQVLTAGNTANVDILLNADIQALDVSSDTATFSTDLTIDGTLTDGTASVGTAGKVLSSTGTGVQWVSLPVYSATSPLFFNSGTGVFSIQVANGTQDGYLTSADWITFNGKQNAGNYITALTGEATATGPGSVAITLSNTAVIGKILTGLSITGGTITATDTILQAFGKAQNQINGKQDTITLTTTGNTGPSTLIGATLNIPNYTDQFVGTVTSVAALTLGTIGTDLSSTVVNSTTTPVITLNVPTASAANRGALSAADWTTFDSKQIAGNYITSLTGEATASGPGAAAITLTNSAVIAKVLTGLNVTGGTVIAADTILAAFGKVQNQINGLIGGSIFQGVWNASTNTPALVSSVGTNGHYYIVSVAGSTNLDGITDWQVGDWAIFASTSWQKVDNTDAVSSVNGFTGAVSLTTDNISEGATNLYYTNTRARTAISLTTTGSSGASTYDNTTGVFNIPTYADAFVGTVTSVAALTLGTTGSDLSSTVANSTTTPVITLNVPTASASNRGALSSADWSTFNGKQATITLTTTGTSGAATLVADTLNIPNYADGGVLSLSAIGGTANANAATITGTVLNLQPASASFGGVVTTGTQTFAGAKTLSSALESTFVGQFLGNTGASTSAKFIRISNTTGDASYGIEGSTPTEIPSAEGGIAYATVLKSVGSNSLILGTLSKAALTINTLQQVTLSQNITGTTAVFSSTLALGGALSGTTANFTGQLTLGSTITNGTYTYTLPGATGTLALVGGAGVGTVTSVAAITLGTSGTDLSSTVANGTTTPVITLNVPDASAANRGVITTGTQTIGGNKTLTGTLYGIALSMTGTTADIVQGTATSGKALRGTATTGWGLYASATTGVGVQGNSSGTGGGGVFGSSGDGYGGVFYNDSTTYAALEVNNNNESADNIAVFRKGGTSVFIINSSGNISNGTYTYTLPSATGTLALTSALTGYLPLTGGTLTGALSGTSATFSSTATATAFIPSGASVPTNGMYLSAANTLNFATNTTNRLSISSAGAATFGGTLTATSVNVVYNNAIANSTTDGVTLATYTTGSSNELLQLAISLTNNNTTTQVRCTINYTTDNNNAVSMGVIATTPLNAYGEGQDNVVLNVKNATTITVVLLATAGPINWSSRIAITKIL